MPRPQFLLLDANVVIFAHEHGIWGQLISKCEITITGTVVGEADFWIDDQDGKHEIDLDTCIQEGRINRVDVPNPVITQFLERFGASYLDRLDPGEADSLAFLCSSNDEWQLCSSDSIVFKTLGCLGRAEQGISLEELLQQVGLQRPWEKSGFQFTRQFRLNYTRQGQRDGITGTAFPPPAE